MVLDSATLLISIKQGLVTKYDHPGTPSPSPVAPATSQFNWQPMVTIKIESSFCLKGPSMSLPMCRVYHGFMKHCSVWPKGSMVTGMVCVLATPWHTTYPSRSVMVFDGVYLPPSRLVLPRLNSVWLDYGSHALAATPLTDLPHFSQCLANIYCKLSTYLNY